MNRTEPQEIFLKGTHGVRRQDKKPHTRFMGGLSQPLTAMADPVTAKPLPENRQNHHGSENRQTVNIAGRVPLHIKAEINRIGAVNRWTESYTVRTLIEQALAKNLGEQFAVMIRHTIQEAVKTELQKDREWLRKINVSECLAAEQARLHAIDVHRLLIPPDQDLNQKIKDNRENALKHLKFYFHIIDVQQEQSQWPLSK